MQATLDGTPIASSADVIECRGYLYFPADAVRMEHLRKSPKTAKDLECPHGVQFYDVTVNGRTHARNAWSYEAPQPAMAHVGGRFGFWEDVQLG
jgi:uncharacterized protein (DUF427 family)